ncbi:MAG: hypothetical protein QNJ44_03910 [Rhodobacter sp.]|nr:hypothetical protein [Rhodobacter sp.]
MGLFDRAAAPEALIELFDRERTAILQGRFDVLERLSVAKDRLQQSVAAEGADPASLLRLKQLGERNAGLLSAMQCGVKAAKERIEVLGKGPATLQTYGATGQRQNMGAARPKMEHRA